MNKTDEVIIEIAQDVAEIKGHLPHLATREFVAETMLKNRPKGLDAKLWGKLIAAIVGLTGAVSALVSALF